jgi:hypothetical protein
LRDGMVHGGAGGGEGGQEEQGLAEGAHGRRFVFSNGERKGHRNDGDYFCVLCG